MKRIGLVVIGAGALLLAGCNNGDEAGKGDATATATPSPTADAAASVVELRGQGLVAGPEAFYFEAGQKEVETALAKALGKALRTGSNEECGAGPITFTDYAGWLTAHFQEGKLVGWNWHGPQDGDTAPTGTVKAAGTVQLAAPRCVVEAAPGFAKDEGSTLGEEFTLGDEIGGFITDNKVEMLYAGTQCFFR
ncbi:MAG: aspartate-semialdehyde dehydrogenase [Erythrobacter sp.]